jgi:hypothetical protein
MWGLCLALLQVVVFDVEVPMSITFFAFVENGALILASLCRNGACCEVCRDPAAVADFAGCDVGGARVCGLADLAVAGLWNSTTGMPDGVIANSDFAHFIRKYATATGSPPCDALACSATSRTAATLPALRVCRHHGVHSTVGCPHSGAD